MKNRLLGLLVLLGSAGMLYYNWHTLMTDGHYYQKMSEISPLGMELGLLMLITPPSWFLAPADPGIPTAARRRILPSDWSLARWSSASFWASSTCTS